MGLVQVILLLNLLIKYILFFIFFYLVGRSGVIIIFRIFEGEFKLPVRILYLKSEILYPIIGIITVGNFTVFANYFIPLKSKYIMLILILFLLINLTTTTSIRLKKFINLDFLFKYILIPLVLVVSSLDISFHYDAGFYHLNHQNWLRETNMVIGMVNIFWPFGMSSIYEYISSILWIDNSFILLHYLNLIFIQFLYIFIYENIFNPQTIELKFSSVFLVLFSLLDNFGFDGGRNGYIYIQGVGKQDTTVGILYFFVTISIFLMWKKKHIDKMDILFLSLITFFVYQIKISSIPLFLLYSIFIINLLFRERNSIKKILIIHIPVFILGINWLIKSYLTTGCLLYPLSVTCVNRFQWYVKGSTKIAEKITSESSLGFINYYHDETKNFTDWFADVTGYPFYTSVALNFTFSLLFLLLFKKFLLKKNIVDKNISFMIAGFILVSTLYIFFYGPIPRYAMGPMLSFVGLIGFYVSDYKIQVGKIFLYPVILFSLILIVKSSSYLAIPKYETISLVDPRSENFYISTNDNWTIPEEGDQCWIMLSCTMNQVYNPEEKLIILERNFFKVAYLNENQ